MSDSNSTVLTLEEGSGVVVVRGGIKVEFNANGGVVVYKNDVPVYPAANTCPQVGDKQADGTVFAGVSPDTGKAMYARPSDEPNTMKWKRAMDYAARYEGHGHPVGTFRVPTTRELSVLFQNRAAIGGFNLSGSRRAGWYWSSKPFFGNARVGNCAWIQNFDEGNQDWQAIAAAKASVRLVRS